MDSTLLIKTGKGIGSAVLISPDGFAITAAHVVGPADRVQAVTHDGRELVASVVRIDLDRDTALLKLAAADETSCLVPQQERPGLGADVFVLGSPAGEELSFSVAKGIVSGHRSLESGQQFLQLDASINPGNSGGPVVDEHGSILGIASWKISHVAMEGLGFAVSIEDALSSLDVSLADATNLDWASLGGRRGRPRAPAPAAEPSSYIDTEERDARRRDWRRHNTMIAGIVVSIVGAGTVIGTGIPLYGDFQHDRNARRALIGVQALGWGLFGVGAAMTVTGALLTYLPKRKKSTSTAASLLRGRF